jgi:hypothetical protein
MLVCMVTDTPSARSTATPSAPRPDWSDSVIVRSTGNVPSAPGAALSAMLNSRTHWTPKTLRSREIRSGSVPGAIVIRVRGVSSGRTPYSS